MYHNEESFYEWMQDSLAQGDSYEPGEMMEPDWYDVEEAEPEFDFEEVAIAMRESDIEFYQSLGETYLKAGFFAAEKIEKGLFDLFERFHRYHM